jgi:hypothetical protein
MTCPSAATARTRSGARTAHSPTMKKVARMSSLRSRASNCGVKGASGPSSKVIASGRGPVTVASTTGIGAVPGGGWPDPGVWLALPPDGEGTAPG